MDSSYLEVLAIFALITANGFFAASEFALIASRKSRIKHLAAKGDKRAISTRNLLLRPDRFLAAIQVGITFVGTLAGVFGGATLVQNLIPALRRVPVDIISNGAEPIAIVVIVILISALSIILGELIPKYVALARPERIALRVAGPISLFSKIAFIPVSFLTYTARMILRIFGMRKVARSSQITEEEINLLISEGTKEGVFDTTEQKLIKSVFEFTDITVRQSMTPRVDFAGIQVDWPQKQVLEIMTKNGYSRYPVYGESLDEIVGVIYTKDVIKMIVLGEMIILKDLIRKPLFVPDSMPLSVLLRKFQKRKIHIAIVLDEFGGTAGLITLEDILEEIVGEIQDEHDREQPEFVAHSDKVAFAASSLRPDELNDAFGVNIPEDISDTLGGLIVESLGRLPGLTEEVAIAGLKFTILEMEGNRIKRMRIVKP